jgi:hypothetical protein
MIDQESKPVVPRAITLSDRRQFLAMPLSERRRRLAELADCALASYEETDEQQLRSEWQGGDVVEY